MVDSPGACSSPGGRTGEQVLWVLGGLCPGNGGCVTDEAARQKLVKKLSTVVSPMVSLLGTHYPTGDEIS